MGVSRPDLLALYILYESGSTLLHREAPELSIPGIVIAALSRVAMPLLARAKRRVAAGIGSGAMHTDSRQTDFCTYPSAILLGGLLLNAIAGWWWADPVAGSKVIFATAARCGREHRVHVGVGHHLPAPARDFRLPPPNVDAPVSTVSRAQQRCNWQHRV
jgi:hypothetical protein